MIDRKKIVNSSFFIISMLISLLFSCQTEKRGVLVTNEEELTNAIAEAGPGDIITMANGVWQDIEIVFKGEGTVDAPISLRAEEPGKVLIKGQSNLGLSGQYLEVSGLVFTGGYTPTNSVIAFRTSENELANNCRVTNCVIDNFSNPERFESDIWVTMYGKNNRFDHNSLIGKRNLGVTMAVRLNTEESRENNHIIEYNYFGPRQNLGANGGETLRIGTSHYSLTNSNTQVRNNYFDRCDGEHETISNKSGSNVYRNNVFYQCRGTLTMRHGKYTLVENNYFLGGGKANTGGIRVINEYQTVRNNYLAGLTGYRFRGALVVMNGVPDSPINRYNQVVDSKIENNVLVNCDHIQLCAGSDDERSATPVGTTLSGNIFMSNTNLQPFTVYDDISGITFTGNYVNEEATIPIGNGFVSVPYALQKNANGLLVPDSALLNEIGFADPALPVAKEETGAGYYAKADAREAFASGRILAVKPGSNTLIEAYASSEAGDVLELDNGGEYLLTKDLRITHPITLRAPSGEKPTITSRKGSFFKIENEGSLELINLKLDGSQSPDMAGNSVISTSRYSMNKNYRLFVRDCEVVDMDVNHSFDFLKIYRSTMADTVLIQNSTFKNITGSILHMAREVEDLGMYNVEHVIIANTRFEDVQGAVAYIYRGGTDESTYGPIVSISDSEFIHSGKGKRNKTKASLMFHGVQHLTIDGSKWEDSAPLNLHLTNGEPVTSITNCVLKGSGSIGYNVNGFSQKNVQIINQ